MREKNRVQEQIDSFDPGAAIEDAWLPPSSWYTEPVFHDIDRDTVFHNNWLVAARDDQLVNPGDYVSGSVANEPYVVVRDMGLDDLRFVRRSVYTVKCNWKVFVDNYLDGGGQNKDQGRGTDFAERIGDRVLYAWIYPNLMINRYGPMMDTNWVLPRGENETEVVFDYYFQPPRDNDEFVSRSLEASDVVQVEDIEICESVQRGLESRSYDKGRYSVRREMGEFHFHRLLAADYATRSR